MAYLLIPLVPAPEVRDPHSPEPLASWVAVANGATDACLVLDDRGRVAGVSEPCAELLGELRSRILGRILVGDVIELVDFSAEAGPGDSYALRIPPLMALTSEMPSRGLLRVRHSNGNRVTLDAVSAPVHAPGGALAGSVSFLSALTPG